MLRIKLVESDPNRKDCDADGDRFPRNRPAHFGNERAHFPNQPHAGERLGQIKPLRRGRAESSLANCQGEKDEKWGYTGGCRRFAEKFSQKTHESWSRN